MIDDFKVFALGDFVLAFFDAGVEEFFDFAAVQADDVVVVVAAIDFVNGFVRLEMVAQQQSGLLELGEDAVDGRQTDVEAVVFQAAVNILCRHMTIA